ncbi:hypothetical protein D3C80_1721030 [compost metagenome]
MAVCIQTVRQRLFKGQAQRQTLLGRLRRKVLFYECLELSKRNILIAQLHLSGIHLGQIEYFINHLQQIGTGHINRLGEFYLLLRKIALFILCKQLGEDK